MVKSIATVVALLLTFTACITEPHEVRVEVWTDRTSYRVGDIAQLNLTNRGTGSITTSSLCWSPIQQLVDGDWVTVSDMGDAVCPLPLYTLGRNATLTQSFAIVVQSTVLEIGAQYRFVVHFRDDTTLEGHHEYSNSFTIVE